MSQPDRGEPLSTQSAAQVAYSADWDSADLRVTLSIYGGPRASHGGMRRSAGLLVNLRDELPIMARYAAALSAREVRSVGTLASPDVLHISRLQTKLTPFSLQPWAVQSNPVHRRAQKAFYKRNLLETPPLVSHHLSPPTRSCCGGTALTSRLNSIRHGAARLTQQQLWKSWTFLPARGGGGLSVHVGELEVSDVPGSHPLTQFVEAVRAACAIRYSYRETYDD